MFLYFDIKAHFMKLWDIECYSLSEIMKKTEEIDRMKLCPINITYDFILKSEISRIVFVLFQFKDSLN